MNAVSEVVPRFSLVSNTAAHVTNLFPDLIIPNPDFDLTCRAMGKPHHSKLKPALLAAGTTVNRNPDTEASITPLAATEPSDETTSPPRGTCIPRRDFLAKGSATIAFLAAFQGLSNRADAAPLGFDPFSYGIASGDPLPDRVIIWTRVNPTANATPGSGLGKTVHGTWEVARNESFTQRVNGGPFATSAETDHTVKIDVDGLQPATNYYFRFKVRGVNSPVGFMRTAPAAVSTPSSVRFGLVSCSNFEAGYFSAYRHLALRDDLDFILHVGDYIYEYANGAYGPSGFAGTTRAHDPATEITTLSDYRRRHACYKADADLRQLHARYSFITTWDDHETANNSWRDGAENHTPGTEGDWEQRKAAGIQAYYEWMPLRPPAPFNDQGDSETIYRKFSFGKLMDLFMLDLRQYRDEQPVSPADSAVISSTSRSLLGLRQTQWLQANLVASQSRWKMIGNSVQIAPIIVIPALLPPATAALLENVFGVPATATVPTPINVDSWDGYGASRKQILGLISGAVTGNPIGNCVFLTGDIHSSYSCDIPANPVGYDPATSLSLGTEFVCTSITSDNVNEIIGIPERVPNGVGGYVRFPGIPSQGIPAVADFELLIRSFNSWVRDVNFDLHGFSVIDVNSQRAQMDNWVITSDASAAFAADPRIDPDATCVFRNAFQTINLSQKATLAAGPLGPRI